MREAIAEARIEGTDLICFSELSVVGYPPRDFLEFRDFIRHSDEVVEALTKESHDIGIVVGAPRVNPVIEGKDLYNCAILMYGGEVVYEARKSLLPTYDIFDEYRYFEPGKDFRVVEFKGKRIALTVCEDIWNLNFKEGEFVFDNPLYTSCPLDQMMDQGMDFIINLSASPFHYKQSQIRLGIIRANVKKYGVPMFYINHVGAQTELIFDGGSVVMSADGKVYDEMPYFEECIRYYDLDEVVRGGVDREQSKDKMRLIHDALVLGIKDYFGKLGFTKAVLGLSGGIDSAVTAVLAARALGAENVKALIMPSEFSSQHSVDDALALVENLGLDHAIIPIKGVYDKFNESLKELMEGTAFDVTEENIQARIRGTLNMAVSNKFGHILLNTTNKSEMAVGYGTLYGDLAGGLSVIGDVYKTEVYELAEYINREGEVIPRHTIEKPPSAELRHNQKDSDSLPEYEVLDPILFQYIEKRKGPSEIIAMGHDEKVVRRALRLVNINEFKRYQTAPMLRVSQKAFGMGRRVPIVGKYLS